MLSWLIPSKRVHALDPKPTRRAPLRPLSSHLAALVGLAAKGFLSLLIIALPLSAARPQRVVSQAVGTDELLLALADPDQIAALSHISHDGQFNPVAAAAKRFPALHDSDAESVLRFRPDLVLVASFTRPETLALLRRAGVRLVVLDRGRVVEEGTHDVLMAQEGAYFNLYQAQARNMDVDMDASRGSDNAEKEGA